MIGLDGTVDVGPRHLEHGLVGQAQALQHDDRLVRAEARVDATVEGQLHVGEHVHRVALGDEQRAPLAGGVDVEALAVDDPHRPGDGVDAEPGPRQVEERQRRDDLDYEVLTNLGLGQQQLDGVLGDDRRAGHGVDQLTPVERAASEITSSTIWR